MADEPTKRKIMVVEDDKNMRDLLERILSVSGFEVLSAPNGLKLFSILKVHHPDLILLDIMMSWIDGYELCRIIKQSEEYKHIPVIFVSARNDQESIDKGFEVGCVDYFTKPFDNMTLVDRIRNLFH